MPSFHDLTGQKLNKMSLQVTSLFVATDHISPRRNYPSIGRETMYYYVMVQIMHQSELSLYCVKLFKETYALLVNPTGQL